MREKLYAERDAMELDEAGGYYCKHVSAMTGEGLHSKGDIAAELGFRDMRIDQLLKERDALAVEKAKAKSVLKQCQEYFIAGIRNEIRPTNEGYLHMICDTFADENPATDAAIANFQAQAIPDGWKLIPEELHIGEEEIELICSQCGNGDEEYGEFVDGIFRVGEVETDDGKKVYGLHVTCADYPEEGSVTIAIFDNPLRKDPAHD